MKKFFILIALILLSFLSSCKKDNQQKEENNQDPIIERTPVSHDSRVYDVEKIGKFTGPDSFNEDLLLEFGAYGTDLGIMVNVKDDQIAFLFGDTFSGPDRTNFWNSNYIAFSKDFDAKDGIVFDSVMSKNGFAITPFAQGKHNDNNETDRTVEVTKIPTGAITINDTTYIFYMSVRYWGANANWNVTYNQCVKSTDLLNWTEVDGLRFDDIDAPNFGQIYPYKDINGEYIYLYAIPGGRHGSVELARVKEENFENKNEYEYLVGKDTWVKGDQGLLELKNKPFYIIDGTAGEVCVEYNPYLEKYMMLFLRSDGNKGIVMLTSSTPDGHFSDEIMLFPNDIYFYYGAFTNPVYFEDDGKTFYITTSNWFQYNVDLCKVTLK